MLALDERQTLGDALAFWARLDGSDAAPGMAAMGLAHLAEVPVRMLSTGQRKRATLARVIAQRRAALAARRARQRPRRATARSGWPRRWRRIARGGGAILAASHQPLGLDGAQQVALG